MGCLLEEGSDGMDISSVKELSGIWHSGSVHRNRNSVKLDQELFRRIRMLFPPKQPQKGRDISA